MTLVEKLRKFGCDESDIQKAKERFLSKEDFYERCLKKYLSEPSFALLGESIKKGNITEIFSSSHSLKGVTANMGLTPIYEEVCIIVEAVRNANILAEGLDGRYERIIELREQLRQLVEE